MNNIRRISEQKYSRQEIDSCIQLLEGLLEDQEQLAYLSKEQKVSLLSASGRISRPDKIDIEIRRRNRIALLSQRIENHERKVRAATGIRSARESEVFAAPAQITNGGIKKEYKKLTLLKPRACYVCKKEFSRLHFFYDSMCPECSEFNYAKRYQTASLEGQVAIITGSRVKIGFQAALKMLRAGAKVIATTRFPVDSALRYSKEKDFEEWKDSLHIYGLDLRHTPSVEMFCKFIRKKYSRLDLP